MKRPLLRIVALGTLVTLGLVVVMLARRGMDDSVALADEVRLAALAERTGGLPPQQPEMATREEATAYAPARRTGYTAPTRLNPYRAATPQAMPPQTMPVGISNEGIATGPAPISTAMANPFADRSNRDEPLDVLPTAAVSTAMPTAAALRQQPLAVAYRTASDGSNEGNEDGRADLYYEPRRLSYATRNDKTALLPTERGNGTGSALANRYATDPAMPIGAEANYVPDNYLPGDYAVGGESSLASGPLNPTPLNPAPLGSNVTLPPAGVGMGMAAAVVEGTGQPGSQQLEGLQSPQLAIEKTAPKQVQVGMPARFTVTIHNVGKVAAVDVEVFDQIPRGARLMMTEPTALIGSHSELVWQLGTIHPGEEATVVMEVEPIAEGEIGSIASVRFHAEATARCIVTKPVLVLKTSAPAKVLIGEEVTLRVELTNQGSGTAMNVVLDERVPAGLQHAKGSDLKCEVGDLAAGASCEFELTMIATRPGPVANTLAAHADGNVNTQHRLELEVVTPALDVAVKGPSRRYLEREACYQLEFSNPGTATAKQVEFVAYLPSGLKFVRATNGGHYNEADRTVHWRLQELPANESAHHELVAMPIESGQQEIRFQGTAEKGVTGQASKSVHVEGIAAIKFQMVDVTDPVEVGGETTYEVRVVNQGTKAASHVELAIFFPAGMQPTGANGPTAHVVDQNRVIFKPLARLAPKADTTYYVRARGLRPGDMRIRVQLSTADMETPVLKEESTRVYADQ